jgi:hypothetical protein
MRHEALPSDEEVANKAEGGVAAAPSHSSNCHARGRAVLSGESHESVY